MTIALIVAAGSGERLGAGMPKALVQLSGRTLLQRSVDVISSVPGVSEIVLALPEGVSAPAGTTGVRGGATRSESVREALAAASGGEESEIVLVHDAARPLLSVELAERVIAAAEADGVDAAVAAAPVSDTIKRAEPAGSGGGGGTGAAGGPPLVSETLRRAGLWAVQTPQAFRRGALERVLSQPAEILAKATDDASLIERDGGTVVIVPSSSGNLKITTPFDLELASLLLDRRKPD